MDFIALGFYAVVCSLLSIFAPNLGSMGMRLTVGAGVGIVAAAVLPVLKGMMGPY